ncbi:MAG: hypothetical protein ACYDD1_07195 [Caulobacteraceae bacterium]
MWRSGSTYLWSRFREAPGAYCYFEPLYAGLAKLTPTRLQGPDWREAVSDNRHPALSAPYYAEYAPLIDRRGVKDYKRELSFHRYALTPETSDPGLQRYIQTLLDLAARQEKTCVLGFNRSALPIGWLKQTFDTYDVYIERDPALLWSSYMQHLQAGNYSYFINLLTIFELNAAHPLFAPLAARLPLRRGVDRLIKRKHFYRMAADRMPHEISYAMVLHMWMLGLLHGMTHCETLIDTGLADRPGYAADTARRIAAGCGLGVDLSALRYVGPAASVNVRDRQAAERLILELFPHDAAQAYVDQRVVASRLEQISPASAELLSSALATGVVRRAA